MKHLGSISGKPISSDSDFIVLSHVKGVLSEHNGLDDALAALEDEKREAASWCHESDCAVFRWTRDGWRAVETNSREEERPRRAPKKPASVFAWP
jgi:hypothetical protein